jgi:hypothetical protein
LRGATWFSSHPAAAVPPGWAAAGPAYDISTTATVTGPVRSCLGAGIGHVFRRAESGWVDITSSPACGTNDALGSFARFVDPSSPMLVPHARADRQRRLAHRRHHGELGRQRPADAGHRQERLRNATISADTAGTTLTCTATSEGGTATDYVTVKRDATRSPLSATRARRVCAPRLPIECARQESNLPANRHVYSLEDSTGDSTV